MRCPMLLRATALLVLVSAGAAQGAPPTAEQICRATRLLAAAEEAQAGLLCVRRALAGVSDPGCRDRAAAVRDAAFARAAARGGCPAGQDSATIGEAVASWVGSTAAQLVPGGPSPSACTARQLAAIARAVVDLARAYALDQRAPDARRLGVRLDGADARAAAAFARAAAHDDCLSRVVPPQLTGIATVMASDLRDRTCPACGIECPCWRSTTLEAAFPPGYFTASGRGGAVCRFDENGIALESADTCVLPRDGSLPELTYPRAGAFVPALIGGGLCASLLTDVDPTNGGTCDHPPAIRNALSAEQSAACVAALRASRVYARECAD